MASPISEKQYQETLTWLFAQLPMFSRIGAAAYKPGLENTERLDNLFCHPHRHFKTIHVGGTNGKGSTSHMLASVLQAHGYKTGLYTSPHLVDFRERMRINGEMIPKEKVVEFVKKWKEKEQELKPSFFELTMMMAFDWFAEENVDFAIIEVGMGGRLDSTNVITPILSIITNISFDHTQFLGDTLDKIATEKAGIIKKDIPVVIGEAEGEVKEVFVKRAEATGSPIIFADLDINKVRYRQMEDGWEISWPSDDSDVPLYIPLAGEYQKKNINTVLHAIQQLKLKGVLLEEKDIVTGLKDVCINTGLRGRWQRINDNPVVICDTGHNMAGLSSTMNTLRNRYPGKKIKFVVGFVNDKDVSHIVGLFPKEGEYYFTQASIPRAMPVDEVKKYFRQAGIDGDVYEDVRSAYKAALSSCTENEIIYVGGSTFVVADLLGSL